MLQKKADTKVSPPAAPSSRSPALCLVDRVQTRARPLAEKRALITGGEARVVPSLSEKQSERATSADVSG